jgi:hypothetical protein
MSPKVALSPEDLKARMDAVERLTNLFRAERMAYLFMTAVSTAILLTSAAVLLVRGNSPGYGAIVGLFGSSGTITYTTGRLIYMWNQALRLLAGERTSPR